MNATMPHDIVAYVDDTAAATNAAWRAALVARDLGGVLRLAGTRPATALDALATEVRERIGIRIVTDGDATRTEHAALLVVPATQGTRAWLFGLPAQRLADRSGVPVLVVRRPATGSYRRALVAIEQAEGARALVAAVRRFTRASAPQLLHVLGLHHEETMRLADVPERVIRELRQKSVARALEDMRLIAGNGEGDEAGGSVSVSFGDPASRILEQSDAHRSDLLVLGCAPRAMLSRLVLGSVAARVLRQAKGDVLLVPPAAQSPLTLAGSPSLSGAPVAPVS